VQPFPDDPDRAHAASIDNALELLRRAETVVWCPEGRRSPTGELEPFTAGIGPLLREARAAVPTAIHGAFEALPKHRAWPRLGKLRVTFGPALRFTDAERTGDTAELRAAAEAAVRTLLVESAAPPAH
jgi:long-chain acyl-CoA synthetase